jgi:hypothetical protein
MSQVLITVDTELSSGRHARGWDARANFESSILGRTDRGEFGIGWQMDRLEAHNLKGVFFVDPMPALVYGEALVADIVGRIVERGHEVQLHVHTEWLEWTKESPVGGRTGHDLGDFSLDDQIVLLRLARDMLVRAGAPRPVAFRAGNYGADDNSLKALATIGMTWDASFNAAYLGSCCRITFPADRAMAAPLYGVTELPVAGFYDWPGHFRPAQICAVSSAEMRAALCYAAGTRDFAFAVVTHSFEMLSRDRLRPNRTVMARFESLCAHIATTPGLEVACFADLDAAALAQAPSSDHRLPPSYLRTAGRIAEQLFATWRYERRLLPA